MDSKKKKKKKKIENPKTQTIDIPIQSFFNVLWVFKVVNCQKFLKPRNIGKCSNPKLF